MELSMMVVSYLILLVMVLVGVAFVTLMEQKILAGTQIRLGPNFVGYWGVMQPFADAVKLLSKETFSTRAMSAAVYYMSPVVSLTLSLVLWSIYLFNEGGIDFMYSVLFFMCVSGLGVYPILSSGWSSNCKYSMLGSLRAVAQMVSYEVSMAVILLSLVWVSGTFSFYGLVEGQYLVWNIFLFMPLCGVWFVSILAETNRTPYDFAEGESELVSGFNTEYGSGGFTLIFMAEYASILLMSLLFSVLFMSSVVSGLVMVKPMMVVFGFVWMRATVPRYRYDKLMGLSWKSFLPVSLFMFSYYLLG
uniref:NADH-ubiquinone oxidoreductase chain 1 n=1 Tax=Gammarus lacustris TaxID=52639 RepID=A0A517LS57_9CRUS|nr:NADH dehydrogenase subunit 1 [Gammarus lacustris]QDS78462.1 NADH dehydrogenase subunit 1 [Gammarus lacustris]